MMPNLNALDRADHASAADETAVKEVCRLMADFTGVVLEENLLLARGLPSAATFTAARKNELADAFDHWAKAAAARVFRLDRVSEPLRKQFVDQLAEFQLAMNENVRRLEAAMEASRRRIDAVMAAVRDEMAAFTPYGANGKARQGGSQTSIGQGVRI